MHFSKHLHEFGYWPVVVAADHQGARNQSPEFLQQLEGRCEIHRHTMRSLRDMIKGKREFGAALAGDVNSGSKEASPPGLLFKARLALTRNIPWTWPVVAKSLRLKLKLGYDLIWATCDPLASLVAGYWISRLTKTPLIVDIRDPITYGTEWERTGPASHRWTQQWEQRVLRHAARIIYTSPKTTEIMQQRSEPPVARKMLTITNGFRSIQIEPKREFPSEKLLFRHIGIIAPHRDPAMLFEGLSLAMRDNERLARDVRLQMAGDIAAYDFDRAVRRFGLEQHVSHLGFVSHEDTLRLARGADVLLLYQPWNGSGRDIVMGKSYEAISAGRPILAIVPPDGGDAWLMQETKTGLVTGLAGPSEIARGIETVWQCWRDQRLEQLAPQVETGQFERRNLTAELARVFDHVLKGQNLHDSRPVPSEA